MKNRTKQMLSMLLAVCMAAMLLPTAAFAQETTPGQMPVGSGVVEVVGEPATEPTGEVTETPATTPTEDDAAPVPDVVPQTSGDAAPVPEEVQQTSGDAAPVPDVVPQTSGDAAPTLNEAQQAFVDAVAALNKDALVALAEAYVADPTEETDAAFYAEYDKADGFDGNSAAELYAALPDEDKAAETVAAANATLEGILSAVNAILDPPEEGTPAPELTQGTEQATTYGVITPAKPAQDVNGVYQITTAGELYWFAALVNGDTTAATGTNGVTQNTAAKAKLVNTITVNENVLNNGALNSNADAVAAFRTWTPIGNSDKSYTGTFDGGNYTIRGLYLNDAATKYAGLFGSVGGAGRVNDVTVADSYILASNCVGGVCGANAGILTNCSNTGTVTDGADDTKVGGVCGNNGGTLTNCTNSGTVNATKANTYAGGVCGYNYTMGGTATLTNCYNTGTVSGTTAGGVCGNNGAQMYGTATLANCYNTGAVSGTTTGGVCGNNSTTGGTATVTNCYNTGAVSGTTTGGVCGSYSSSSSGATFTNCYYQAQSETDTLAGTTYKTAAQFASGEVAWLLNGRYSFGAFIPGKTDGTQAWYQNLAEGGDAAPVLKSTGSNTVYSGYSYDANGFGTAGYSNTAGTAYYQAPELKDGVYQIKNAGNLYWFAALVNGDTSAATGTGGVTKNTAAKAKLVNTITVNTGVLNTDGTLNGTPARTWTPIGNDTNPYTGTFDGGNNTINGLYLNDTSNNKSALYVGLFGCVGAGGTVKDVTVADSWLQAKDIVGGVCGQNNGELTNCTNKGTVSAAALSAKVGGVCGQNNGELTNCTNNGAVSPTNNSANAGGVCGYNTGGTLTNCTNNGTVSAAAPSAKVGGVCGYNDAGSVAATLTDCTNNGAVTGGDYASAGGVCGYNNAGSGTATLTDCTNSGKVTGGNQASVGGVSGQNDKDTSITNCTNSGTVTGGGQTAVGGVSGKNQSGTSIKNCTNSGTVTGGAYATVGGVSGQNDEGTLTNCNNSGVVTGNGSSATVGGVCGSNAATESDSTATLTYCYNTGALSATGTFATVGGVCGSNSGKVFEDDEGNRAANGGTATLTYCYNTGALTGESGAKVGGVCGNNEADEGGGTATLTNCYNAGALTGTTTGGVSGQNRRGTLTNCYYKAESETETDTFDGTTAKTVAQFASGEVAWLLDTNGGANAHSKVWAQDTASPKFAKADKTDVVYRALFLPKGGDTPVVGTSYQAAGAPLTAPAGYVWANVPATMPAADTTYRWTVAVQITKQPTAPAAKTYGYTDTQSLTVAATAAEGKTITYQWLKNGVAIDGATAATYTIPTGLAVGNYVYTCEVTCDGDTVATTPVTFTVNKAPLTWDVSGLTAQKPYDGTTTATVTGTLKLSGVVAGDDVGLSYKELTDSTPLTGSYADKEIGTGKTVTVTVTDNALTGAKSANYTLPTGDIKITTGRIAAPLPNPPQTAPDSGVLKLTVDPGIPMVPDALKNDPTRDTPAKIEAAMQAEAAKRLPGVPAANIITMDIELWYSNNGGVNWTVATQDKFPAAGVTVVVPYGDLNLTYAAAQGMGFTVTHMISMGDKAGTIENPDYTLTQAGVQFTLNSLSPVTIAYTGKAAVTPPTSPAVDNTEDTTSAPAATPAPTAVPAPGKFTVNAWVNVLAGGTVSPMGNTTCTEGQNLTYTITPAAGYRIAKVTVDGVDVGAVTSYTFKGLNRNHQIGAYFEKTTTATAGTIPATGDTAPLLLWAALMALAAMGLAAAYAMRKKNHR